MSTKSPLTDDGRYIPSRSDTAGETPNLRQGEVGTNEIDGTVHVMRTNGFVSTLPTAGGVNHIETLTQAQYDALVAATATISTTLYVVTPNS